MSSGLVLTGIFSTHVLFLSTFFGVILHLLTVQTKCKDFHSCLKHYLYPHEHIFKCKHLNYDVSHFLHTHCNTLPLLWSPVIVPLFCGKTVHFLSVGGVKGQAFIGKKRKITLHWCFCISAPHKSTAENNNKNNRMHSFVFWDHCVSCAAAVVIILSCIVFIRISAVHLLYLRTPLVMCSANAWSWQSDAILLSSLSWRSTEVASVRREIIIIYLSVFCSILKCCI